MQPQKLIKTGDLVVYAHPIKFFTQPKRDKYPVVGLVLEGGRDLLVKILWSDGLCCLDSLEDVKILDYLI
jgi:hypothetical protein